MVDKSPKISQSTQGTARRRFLNNLAETGSVRLAAEASGRSRDVWFRQKEGDQKFAREWDQALEAYVEILEAEANRRALNGEEEPIFYGGKQVGSKSKTSDSLLMFRLKALRPNRYKETNGGQDSKTVKVEVRSFAEMEVKGEPEDANG